MTAPVTVLTDLLFMTGRRGGMESYVRNLYAALGTTAPGFRFVALASRELAATGAPWFPGELVDSGVPAGSRIRWTLGEFAAVAPAARRAGADVVHAPANLALARTRIPTVLTLHDVLPLAHPEWVPGPYAAVLRTLVRRSARAAARVVTVSEASRRDIGRYAGRSDAVAIPLAGGSVADPAPDRADHDVLAVGNRMPHKNFDGLIEALAAIPADRRPRAVITGSGPEDPLVSLADRLGVSAHVRFVAWVDDAELDLLYRRARVVVVPSLFEGFGLPILEAMARSRPVLAHDLPVLREVAGDAARYVDARRPEEFASAIVGLLADDSARDELSRRGRERAGLFSWERTARATAEVLRDAAHRRFS